MAPEISVTRSFPVPLIIVILVISFHLLFPSCSPSLNPPPPHSCLSSSLLYTHPSLTIPNSYFPPHTHTHTHTLLPLMYLLCFSVFCVLFVSCAVTTFYVVCLSSLSQTHMYVPCFVHCLSCLVGQYQSTSPRCPTVTALSVLANRLIHIYT